MTMTIISKPYPKFSFNGKIYVQRVAHIYAATKNSFNLSISDDYEINHQLKKGEWK